MKKLIIASLICLGTVPAFASGKITLQNNLYDEGKTYRPMIGFGVYEKLTKKLHLNAWTGYGIQPLEVKDDVNWLVAKAQVDMEMGKRLVVSPGYQYKHLFGDSDTPSEDHHIPYFSLSYKLW